MPDKYYIFHPQRNELRSIEVLGGVTSIPIGASVVTEAFLQVFLDQARAHPNADLSNLPQLAESLGYTYVDIDEVSTEEVSDFPSLVD